jgi:high-affinity Fe2+/Pb2+ permease
VLTVFLILLREGLEAALVVGIVVGYLVKIGRRDALRWVWAGIVAALIVSLGLGILVFVTIGDLPSTIQEPIEGIAAVFALGVLTWMLFWMRRQGRALKGELEGQLDAALRTGSTAALVGLAFVAIVREGLETALFLLALFRSAAASGKLSPTLPIAGLAGLAVAVLLGAAIVRGAIRLQPAPILQRHRGWDPVRRGRPGRLGDRCLRRCRLAAGRRACREPERPVARDEPDRGAACRDVRLSCPALGAPAAGLFRLPRARARLLPRG